MIAKLVLASALIAPASAFAAPAVKSDNPYELAEEFQQSRKDLVEAEAQKRKIMGSLYVINIRMKKISREKNHLTDELFQVQDTVKNLARMIASLETEIETERASLKKRLRALYKLSGEGFVGAVFSQAGKGDLDEMLRFLKIVTDADYRLIRGYQTNVAAYKKQRQKLKAQVERLVAIERNIKRKEGMLAAEHRAKSKIVSELDRERSANLDRIKTIRKATKNLADGSDGENWNDLLKPSIFEQKGQLAQPVLGSVVHDFGLLTDDKFKTQISHKGWTYAAPTGSPVTSIFEGTVVHAGWVRGFGETVIVDHGDHYYSLYAYIARPKVKAGDTIKKGDALAEVGVPREGRGTGLYFEIRHFSEPENPVNWIAKRGGPQPVAKSLDGTTSAMNAGAAAGSKTE